MRIVSFNVQNFFARPRAMNQDTWAQGRPVLAAHTELNILLEKPTYTAADKARILELLGVLGLDESDMAPMAILRQIRGRLVKRPPGGVVEVAANGRGSWVGWVDLTTEPVTSGRDRQHGSGHPRPQPRHPRRRRGREPGGAQTLQRRSATHAWSAPRIMFPHLMLIDGNDDRGIDVALLTQAGYPLGAVRSHIDDTDEQGVVFSRDCPEYELRTPGGHRLVVLVNHLKSKGYGPQASNNDRRRRQAQRVADIYRRLRRGGRQLRRGHG